MIAMIAMIAMTKGSELNEISNNHDEYPSNRREQNN